MKELEQRHAHPCEYKRARAIHVVPLIKNSSLDGHQRAAVACREKKEMFAVEEKEEAKAPYLLIIYVVVAQTVKSGHRQNAGWIRVRGREKRGRDPEQRKRGSGD